MKKTYYIWIACAIGLTVGMGTMGVWGLSDTTSIAIAWGLGIILIASVFVVVAFAKKDLSTSLSTLYESSLHNDMKIIGTYNAYHHEGDKFKTMMPGDPAIIDYNEDQIRIRVLPDGQGQERAYCFPKEDTEILWVGNSGRLKDYLTWLEIKGSQNSSLISAFTGTHHESTEWYTGNLYFKLADSGYKVGIDSKKRGLLMQLVGIIALFGIGVKSLISNSIMLGVVSIGASIIILVLELRPRKGPKRKNG
ncbi:hypothetical protein [Geobacter sulfurreducens]|uniref:hypothetical protein n=1 Tax=Geobacter sulfurreducens TaxID=35554 RepID=UPI000E65A4CA|nr:hypothetical protein [Geobacter sulfurreducens]